MSDILIKFNLLDFASQKEVKDFIDFLLQKSRRKKAGGSPGYKEKIVQVSEWSEEEVNNYKNNNDSFQQWQPKEW